MADQLVLPAPMCKCGSAASAVDLGDCANPCTTAAGWQARSPACSACKRTSPTSAAAAEELQGHMLSMKVQGATEAGSDWNQHYCLVGSLLSRRYCPRILGRTDMRKLVRVYD